MIEPPTQQRRSDRSSDDDLGMPEGGPRVGPRGCTFIKADGRLCGATRLRNVPYCLMHDPASAEVVAEARRLGGEHRRVERALALTFDVTGIGSVAEIQRVLELATYEALQVESPAARARLLLEAVRTGARLHEVAQLEARVATLEATPGPSRPPAPAEGLIARAKRRGGSVA